MVPNSLKENNEGMKTNQGGSENEIRALFLIMTPGQAYTWRHVIDDLVNKGHKVRILARQYESTTKILDSFGFQFESFRPMSRQSLRMFEILSHVRNGRNMSRKFRPTVIVGFGVSSAVLAASLRKPCIVFTDGESVPLQNSLSKLMASVVITPSCFKTDLGRKHVRLDSYKELFYLHPNRFKPDPSVFDEIGLAKNEKYVLVRFNSFVAVHDIGVRGFSLAEKYELVNELEKYCRVFISTSGDIPSDLKKYLLPTKFDRIHQVLYHASLYVGDGGTMAVESALLGTPSVHLERDSYRNQIVDASAIYGNFDELANKYHLIDTFCDAAKSITKAVQIMQQGDAKQSQRKKLEQVLKDKIDPISFMVASLERISKGSKNKIEGSV
jgi:uncharacterized protein